MANAAAKKAAAARKAAVSTYTPILIGINVIYILLRLGNWKDASKPWQVVGTIVTWGLQYVAYSGILTSFTETKSSKSTDLVGGIYLDLMGLTVVVQFGTALFSSRIYWLLLIVPPIGIWKLYKSIKSAIPSTTNTQQTEEPKSTTTTSDKRQKRADRRRQKWS